MELVDQIPEDKLVFVIQIMQGMKGLYESYRIVVAKNLPDAQDTLFFLLIQRMGSGELLLLKSGFSSGLSYIAPVARRFLEYAEGFGISIILFIWSCFISCQLYKRMWETGN